VRNSFLQSQMPVLRTRRRRSEARRKHGACHREKAIHGILSRKPEHVKKIVISLTSNGEPLVNFDMVDSLISYCNSIATDEGCAFSFAFATNGTLLTKPILDRILKHENLKSFSASTEAGPNTTP